MSEVAPPRAPLSIVPLGSSREAGADDARERDDQRRFELIVARELAGECC